MDRIDRLLARANPVKFMMEMPIDLLENLVDRMEKAQSEARTAKIMEKIFRRRGLTKRRVRAFRGKDVTQKMEEKDGRKSSKG